MTRCGVISALLWALCVLTGCGAERLQEEHGHDQATRGHDHAGHGRKGDRHDHDPGAGEQVVRISPEAVVRSGIRVAEAEAAPGAGGIEVPAEVQAEPDREAHVSSVVSGQLARVKVSIGDRVDAGQALAVLRSVALGEARAQAARARADVDVAEAKLRRQEGLAREGIGVERQLLEARAEWKRAQAELSAAERALEVYGRGGVGSEVTIKSPIAGRVVSRHATVGEVVAPGEVLFEVTDTSRVWVTGRVYQQDAGRVREGAAATLSLQAHPGRTFTGHLDYVAPAFDEHTRTLPVRMVLDNPDGALRPGSFGSLSIHSSPADGPSADPAGRSAEVVLAVTAEAVQRLGGRSVVFVPVDDDGGFRAVPVTVGGRARGRVYLRSGLGVGDRYVAEGGFVLKSELSRGELGHGHAH
ncbi:efflux RND transporter periplasmic adaptor subunit [Haliangium sp.]|uniref:efflux RND transporter periplasmic adaptor subunit n=1 Tax=Haliangium sp. TaxID=2663208 RepID=UPI003D0D0BF7